MRVTAQCLEVFSLAVTNRYFLMPPVVLHCLEKGSVEVGPVVELIPKALL